MRWSYFTGANRSAPAVWSEDETIAVSTDRLRVLESSGAIRWSYAILLGNSAPAWGESGALYTGSIEGDGRVYALDSSGALVWSYATDGGYLDSVTPDEASGRIYAGSVLPLPYPTPAVSRLYALTTEGALVWSYQTGDTKTPYSILMGQIVADKDGYLYHGSVDGRMYALTSSGAMAWSYDTGTEMQGGAALGQDGRAYAPANDGRFYVFGHTPTPTPTVTPTQVPYNAIWFGTNI